jgi:hypothetical protein
MRLDDLLGSPNPLAEHYRRFRVADRLLLTGHSHQAWPDRAMDGHMRAWEDAAELVDGKWERAFRAAERVREGYARLLDDDPENIALAAGTHDLLVRFLSALPLRERPRVVTTDGEFHTIRRQIARLEEEGLEVVRVPATPADALAERLGSEVDGRTAAGTRGRPAGAVGRGFANMVISRSPEAITETTCRRGNKSNTRRLSPPPASPPAPGTKRSPCGCRGSGTRTGGPPGRPAFR